VEIVASLSQGRTAATNCGLYVKKSVPVIFEPPCSFRNITKVPFYPFFGSAAAAVAVVCACMFVYERERCLTPVRKCKIWAVFLQQIVSFLTQPGQH
jgi:hypothetical protein